jgi:adenylate cyclase
MLEKTTRLCDAAFGILWTYHAGYFHAAALHGVPPEFAVVSQFEGTPDQFSGDGIMVFFNDPVPISDPAERAVKMAVAMREAATTLIADWRRRDRELGFGAGIAQGYATLGQIGFAERSGYTAIGTVCNLAARLCR